MTATTSTAFIRFPARKRKQTIKMIPAKKKKRQRNPRNPFQKDVKRDGKETLGKYSVVLSVQ